MAGNLYESLRTNRILRVIYEVFKIAGLYHYLLAAFFAVLYGNPSRKIKVIGITGTKGKTTATAILAALLEAAGKKTALLSSVYMKTGGEWANNRSGNSMPGRGAIQKFLAEAAREGAEYAVVEVTSQGILLHRDKFIRFAAAGITNIHPEHIEAHGSFENYRAVKFSFLRKTADKGRKVFVNADDEASRFFADNLKDKAEMYSAKDLPALPAHVEAVLPGEFNRQNIALAVALARSLGISEEAIWGALEKFQGVPGRAEFIQREPFAVVVDYAHTPDSLEAIYKTVRQASKGKLICVLSAAGGGRDKWKRPQMGKIAAENCADIILTDEDPYDENPKDITKQIAAGFLPDTARSEILDRGEAIKEAVRRAAPGDAVIITGKGSETSIHLAKGKIIGWSDREAAEAALRSR